MICPAKGRSRTVWRKLTVRGLFLAIQPIMRGQRRPSMMQSSYPMTTISTAIVRKNRAIKVLLIATFRLLHSITACHLSP